MGLTSPGAAFKTPVGLHITRCAKYLTLCLLRFCVKRSSAQLWPY